MIPALLLSILESTLTLSKVITSSFASIINPFEGNRPGYTYSEKDWNPITEDQAVQNPSNGYRASKNFA